jgi:hypothetical protein
VGLCRPPWLDAKCREGVKLACVDCSPALLVDGQDVLRTGSLSRRSRRMSTGETKSWRPWGPGAGRHPSCAGRVPCASAASAPCACTGLDRYTAGLLGPVGWPACQPVLVSDQPAARQVPLERTVASVTWARREQGRQGSNCALLAWPPACFRPGRLPFSNTSRTPINQPPSSYPFSSLPLPLSCHNLD